MYEPEDFQVDGPPTSLEGSYNVKRLGGHIPYCRIEWDSPQSIIQHLLGLDFNIQFDVDMQHKQVVGMNLSGKRFFRPEPKVAVVPEMETDYQAAGASGKLMQILDNEPAIHMTPTYSNATLMATLPYVSAFAQKLDLPVTQPLTAKQVLLYAPPAYLKKGFQNNLMLTNHYWFSFLAGYVYQFGSPDNWFEEKGTKTNWPHYTSKDCITTNEAIEFARDAFRKLGYKPEDFHMNVRPTTFTNATDTEQYAYCQIDWDSPDGTQDDEYHMEFDIDMQHKQVVGMILMSKRFFRPDPKIDVVPELESDYQKRIQGHMFIRTNAPQMIHP